MRIGIVAFGDYCDMSSKDMFGRAYQVCELTNDENKLIELITNAQDTSGGDGDEFYELVIKKIVEETNWREGSTKAVLLIADAEPHKVGYSYRDRVVDNQIDWREEAKKAAKKGIKFDTLTIDETEWYKELSSITNGVSAPFSTSSKTSQLVEAAALARGGEKTRGLLKDYIEGEDRVLRGYKMQFVSRDGKYKCMDMDIERTEKETGERLVNINTISQLIYNGVKYIVE